MTERSINLNEKKEAAGKQKRNRTRIFTDGTDVHGLGKEGMSYIYGFLVINIRKEFYILFNFWVLKCVLHNYVKILQFDKILQYDKIHQILFYLNLIYHFG